MTGRSLLYICILIFAILAFITLLLGNYFKNAFIDSLVRTSIEQQANIILENYTKSVWNRFYPVISYLYNQSTSEWDVFPEYQAFKEETRLFFSFDNPIKIVIYNMNDYVLFDSSTDIQIAEQPNLFSSLVKSDKRISNLIQAKNGKTAYSIIPQFKLKGQKDTKTIFNIFIPLQITQIVGELESEAVKSQGVIEFNFDITNIYQIIENTKLTIILLMITGLAIFTATVIVASKKAEGIIEKQQDESLEMSSAKMQAESESKAKSQFLANVSHELRTPLNAIIGFSEIINSESMGPIGNEQYKEFIKDIHTSGVHLLSLINDILDFSKAEENKLQIDFEQTDLTKVIKVCMRMVSPRAEDAKVKLTEMVPNEHLIILADQKRMKQVLLNLLSNAVKFTPEGGEVIVKTWKDLDNSTVSLEVKDSGVGMAAQDLARALAPFGQIDNKLSRRYEGTGLGLPLTKKLVELMKGRFEIKSEPGLGTTIIMTFILPSNEIEANPQLDIKPTIVSDPPAQPTQNVSSSIPPLKAEPKE